MPSKEAAYDAAKDVNDEVSLTLLERSTQSIRLTGADCVLFTERAFAVEIHTWRTLCAKSFDTAIQSTSLPAL